MILLLIYNKHYLFFCVKMNIDSVLELIEELKVFALKLQEQNENEKIKIVTKYEDEEEFLVIHQIDNIQYYISKVKKAGIKRSLERSKRI